MSAFLLLSATAAAQVVIKVTSIPALKPNGRPWDAGIGFHRFPDVFLRVADADGQIISVETLVKMNADPAQVTAQNPLIFPLKSAAPKYPLRIEMLDYDEITASDFMGLVVATGPGAFADASGKTQLVVADTTEAYPEDVLAAYVAALEEAKILPKRPPLDSDLNKILVFGIKKGLSVAQSQLLRLVLGTVEGGIFGSIMALEKPFQRVLTDELVAGQCTTSQMIAIEQYLQKSFAARYETIDRAFGYKRPKWSVLDDYSSRHSLGGAQTPMLVDPIQVANERATALDYQQQMESERIYQEYALEQLHKFRDRFVAPNESSRKRPPNPAVR